MRLGDGTCTLPRGGGQYRDSGEPDALSEARFGRFANHRPRPDEAAWDKCCEMLRRHGKGKIELVSELWHGEVLTAEFYGKYVALAAEG